MNLSRFSTCLRLGIAVALTSAAAGAFAQGLDDPRAADTDGDGAISAAEAEAAAVQRFKALDRDGNGSLTQTEFVDARLAALQKADANGDGKTDRSELRGQLRALRNR